MNHFLYTKSNIQRSVIYIILASLLAIAWGLIGYYVILGVYFIMCFLFYPGIFLLGMLFKVRNWIFIPVTYVLIYSSDWISRDIGDLQKLLFTFFVLYNIELIILSIMKVNLDAKDYEWNEKKKWMNRGVVAILPVISLCIYYFIIRQVFVFE